jgi:Uma2 family endonuclease
MVATTNPLTYEDLTAHPEGDGNRYELLGGELFATPSPSRRHARIAANVSRLMGNHVADNGLGMVFPGPVDIRLTTFDVVIPDILFLRGDRLHLFNDKLVNGAPDLIVEVLSVSTRARDLTTKLQLCARTGVSEYWTIDSDALVVIVYALSAHGSCEVVPGDGSQVSSRVLPELELSLEQVFHGAT